MTTSDRVLSVLGLFSLERPEWTVEDAASELKLAISTAYRYFRSLTSAGLLVALETGRYVLGPAIIQYDRQIRLHDPLTKAAQPIMKRLTEELPAHTVTLLCRLFRDQVMCVHQEFHERPDFAISYERGRPMPLFRGAASKIILAHMPLRAIKALYEEHPTKFAQANLGRNWEEAKERLRALRTAGYCVTQGEVDPGMCGISVPILEASGSVTGSIGIVIPAHQLEPDLLDEVPTLLRKAAEEISWAMSLGSSAANIAPVAPPVQRVAKRGARQEQKHPSKAARRGPKPAKRARA